MAGRPPRYTVDQVVHALRASSGIVELAAQALKCSPSTIDEYMKRHERCRLEWEDQRRLRIAAAEGKLHTQVLRGESWAIAFTLKTIGKGRGYVERVEFEQIAERWADIVADAVEACAHLTPEQRSDLLGDIDSRLRRAGK